MTTARIRAAIAVLLIIAVAVISAWALAHPATSPAMAAVRAVADGAAVACLGLAAVPLLDDPRHRTELAHRGARPLAAASALWAVAELVRLVLAAAQAADVAVLRLPLHTAVQFTVATAAGRSGLVSVTAAALIGALAVAGSASGAGIAARIGVAAIGITARVVTGHLSDSTVGALAVAVHALAAAVWCGTLLALALTVDRRGQWARVLGRFSQLSLGCVAVLLIGGVCGALVTVDSVHALYGTGYGRLVLAKVVLTIALVALAWRNRRRWLPAARAHRLSAAGSRARSLIELALMAVTVTVAAALAVTG